MNVSNYDRGEYMSKDGIKVSIITVSYNSVKTIEQTIQSVLGQSYKNIEYIIIDGASTDGTLDVIQKYSKNIACVISEKDNGIYDAMNKGLQKATGELIGIINSDDWYEKDAVENVVLECKKTDADIIFGNMLRVDVDGKESLHPMRDFESMWYQMSIPHPTVFIKKKVYDTYGVFDLQYELAADYELLLRLYSQALNFHFCNKIIAHFREGGASKQRDEKCREEAYDIALRYAAKHKDREFVISKINEFKRRDYVKNCWSHGKKYLGKWITSYFGESHNSLVIFGTGIWGQRCYEALRAGNVKVDYFVSNIINGENSHYCGKEIKLPSQLKGNECVLIASINYAKEMKNQLHSMGHEGKKYIDLMEVIDGINKIQESNRTENE